MNSTGSKAIIVGFLLLFGVFGRSVAQEPLLFDLKRVADRPPPDVEKILGNHPSLWMMFLEAVEAVPIQQQGPPI